MTRGEDLLRRFERRGVILSECGESMSLAEFFGLALPLREIVPSLLGLLSADCAFVSREEAQQERAARRAAAELRTFLNAVVGLAVRLHGTTMSTVQLFDGAEGILHIAAQRGLDQAFVRSFWSIASNDMSACSRAVRERRTVVVEDVYADESYAPYRAMAAEAGYAAVQATPMITSGGKLMGVISTYFKKARHLTRGQLRILTLYAGIAADVLERLTFRAGEGRIFATASR